MPAKLLDLPRTIYLTKDFRDLLFCKAYREAGSLAAIGRKMGYPARRGLNGVSRDMWLGKIGIPRHRIQALANLAGMNMEDVISNIIPKQRNVQSDDWQKIYARYVREYEKGALER